MKTVFSSVFEGDFAEIVTWFAREASLDVSLRFEKKVTEAFRLICSHPEMGRRRTDLKQPNVRSFRVAGFESYLIFYQVREDDVFFVRLIYGGMDLPALFAEN